MNLDRLPVLAAAAASAITSAGSRFQKLNRRRKQFGLSVIGACFLGVTLVAQDKSTAPRGDSARSGSGDPTAADLRVLPPAGFKGTTHSKVSAKFTNGTGGFGAEEDSKLEVTAADSSRATFKLNMATNYQFWGSAIPNPHADLCKRRLCIQTIDRNGTVISSEGESPDSFAGGTLPDHPVKVGETWVAKANGTGVNAGDTMKVTNTLREMISIKGRRMAVIDYSTQSDHESVRGTMWVDVETGLTAKNSASGSGEASDGSPITLTYSSWFAADGADRWVE